MLLMEKFIAGSDDDMPIGASVVAGFDDNKDFVVEFEFNDYENPERDYLIRATVEMDEAREMAGRIQKSVLDLPDLLQQNFPKEPKTLPGISDMEKTFQEILDFLLDNGAHYTLKRAKSFAV